MSVCRLSCEDITIACRICTNKSAVPKAQEMSPDMLTPEVDEVYCIGADFAK